MGTPRGSLVPLDADSLKTEVQLRVTPLELQFSDAVPGRVYRLPFTVRNLGRGNRKIRFKEPSKPQFKLLLTNLDKELAPGLQMTAVVEYRPDKYEDTFDQLVISSGNKIQEIPLIGLIPFCKLEIESTVVDFGTLVSNSKVHSKEINIINHGKVPGMFNIDYQGQLPVLFFPTYGAVKPKSSVIIRVDFCADQPNLVNEVAKVSLQGRPDIFLNIQAHVVEQIIELFNMNNDSKLECIRFGPIFFGTSKIEHALLYNNSPEPINWVAVIENDCVGEELGANIRQRTDFALDNLTYLSKIKKIDVTTIVSCVPNEGALLPYQKTVIRLGFTPKLVVDDEKNVDPSHRQDYAFFMRFDTIGSKDGFLSDDNHKNIKSDQFQKVELALTGSGLPVLLRLDPEKFLNFSPCAVGEYSEAVCIIENQSKFLPVTYNFPKTAHFKIEPESGKISEGCTQSVKCSFTPHQIGVFKKKQVIEIIGPVADENFQSSSMKPFHYLYLNFNSVCTTVTKDIVMEANTGISPLVSNPAGHFVVKDVAKYKDCPPVAMLQSAKTKLHDHRLNENKSLKNALVALPNDRAASIRPGERDKCYREDIHPSNDKDIDMNSCNDADIDRHPSNDTDTEIEPSFDLTPPLVSQEEIEDSLTECPIKANRLLTTRELASKEAQTLHQKVLKALKSRPCTVQEKHDCSIILTPKQIHQVIVGPSVLNFGNICVNSRNTHLLHVVNMLSMHILIRLDANFEELQKTKQFSYVIPPTSTTYLPVVFESSAIGKFWKSFTFTVNNAPGGHILVMADVFSIKLELSSNTIVLKPRGFLLKSCFWGTVTLYNHLNLPAQFGWQPVNSIKGIAFSIRPDKGVVEAYSSLHCEVMWRPGFCYSEEGEFVLHVRDGNTLMLKCVTQFGHTEASFLEPKTVFDNSPQGLTTWRQAVLYNLGYNHAYFKVSEQSLLPIINIVPSQGVIPFGGVTILNISCTPFVVEKFETKAKIIIHGGNTVDIRIVGFVEIADVEIKPGQFSEYINLG
ncbi:cilia and flagella-associated protein 47-like [Ctenodactylus gundi]